MGYKKNVAKTFPANFIFQQLSLGHEHNDQYFADNISNCISFDKKFCF